MRRPHSRASIYMVWILRLNSPTKIRDKAELGLASGVSKPTGSCQEKFDSANMFSTAFSLTAVGHVKASPGRADAATTSTTRANPHWW